MTKKLMSIFGSLFFLLLGAGNLRGQENTACMNDRKTTPGLSAAEWEDWNVVFTAIDSNLVDLFVSHDQLDILSAKIWFNDNHIGDGEAVAGNFVFLFFLGNMNQGDYYSFQFLLSDSTFSEQLNVDYELIFDIAQGYNPGFDDIELTFVAIDTNLVEMTVFNPDCAIQYAKVWLNGIFLNDLGAYDGVVTYVFNLNEFSEGTYFDFHFVCSSGLSQAYNITYDFLVEIAAGYEQQLANNTYIYTTGTNETVTLLWDAGPLSDRNNILGCNVFKRTTPDGGLVQLNEELIVSTDGHYRFTDETPSDPDIPPYYEIWLAGSEDTALLTDTEAHWLLKFKPRSQTELEMFVNHWDPENNPQYYKSLHYLKVWANGIFLGDFDYGEDAPITLPMDGFSGPGVCYDFAPVYPNGTGPSFEVCDPFIQYMLSFFVPFPASGASWHYNYAHFWIEGYVNISYVDDTIIDNKMVGKLQKKGYFYNHELLQQFNQDLGYEYMYSDSDRVYVYRHNQFYVLWDFSAAPGDSWLVPESFETGYDSTALVTVIATGDTIINGLTLRYFELEYNYNYEEQQWAYHGLVVERIGPIQDYLLPHSTFIADLIEGGPLRCYSDDNFGLYETGIAEACNFLVGLGENKSAHGFSIAPNPASDEIRLHFDLSVSGDVLVEVFGLDGRLLQSYSVANFKQGSHNLVLNTARLSPGVYILKLNTDYGVSSERLIIR
jgi:hypothetical protein